MELAKQRALEQSKSLDTHKLKLLEDSELRHKQTIELLEKDLEEREARSSEELREIQLKSEESLSQLRNFYELEKERLECRLIEERERGLRKVA